jgi:hypothetical protein
MHRWKLECGGVLQTLDTRPNREQVYEFGGCSVVNGWRYQCHMHLLLDIHDWDGGTGAAHYAQKTNFGEGGDLDKKWYKQLGCRMCGTKTVMVCFGCLLNQEFGEVGASYCGPLRGETIARKNDPPSQMSWMSPPTETEIGQTRR